MNHFEKYDRDTRKELSQNYIKNPSLVRKLLEFTDFTQGDIIVDIGSGQGAFTDELLALGHTVHAVEKDPKNAQDVFTKHKKNKNFSIFNQDALFYHKPKDVPYHVFSNPPFTITSKLVKYFFLKKPFPVSGYMVMQREAAERLVGLGVPSLVSILLRTLYDIEIVHTFKTSDFSPRPNVTCVFVEFVIRTDVLPTIWGAWGEYRDMVTLGYALPEEPAVKKFREIKNKLDGAGLPEVTRKRFMVAPTIELTQEEWELLFALVKKK